MSLDALDDDWTVWSEQAEKVVLAFRPDVFDGGEFPAACLPTIYVTRGQRDRRPGQQRVGSNWFLTLYLEPDVELGPETYENRDAAVDGAVALADRFTAGDVDYHSLYQVPRPDYFDRLDELTGSTR